MELIDELMAKAAADEDEGKAAIYGRLVEHVVASSCTPYEVRMLGNAVRALTVDDLGAFVYFGRTGAMAKDLPPGLQDSFWKRVEAAGLYRGGGARFPTNISRLGRVLFELVDPLVPKGQSKVAAVE